MWYIEGASRGKSLSCESGETPVILGPVRMLNGFSPILRENEAKEIKHPC